MSLAARTAPTIVVGLAILIGMTGCDDEPKKARGAQTDGPGDTDEENDEEKKVTDGDGEHGAATVKENRLAKEKSPYLLQHKNNPVDWFPWGEEAFAKATKEDKPVFLSIGYAACHWCHVMEHESFENETIAALLNEHFVSIKVDREERPDVDSIYMTACQAMTGSGGWPLTIFMTPDKRPFFAGTYFPPEDDPRFRRPGFRTLITEISKAWEAGERDDFLRVAEKLSERIRELQKNTGGDSLPPVAALDDYLTDCGKRFDSSLGGFGRAPKFPRPSVLDMLLRVQSRRAAAGEGGDADKALLMTVATLDAMAAGGMYDQVGGGFHRYSVDAEWLVPHFEKMLYDNAQLVDTYLDAWLITREERHAETIRETLEWTLREMTHADGGFFSSLDADSLDADKGEKEEGAFYVWGPDEIRQVIGADEASLWETAFGVTKRGNFEATGKTVLHVAKPIGELATLTGQDEATLRARLEASRKKLFDAREKRPRPGLDDKVLTAWNGLMIGAMARSGAALNEPRWVEAARRAAAFVLKNLRREDGRLLRRWREGEADFQAYLDDHAFLGDGLISLYEATGEVEWLREAKVLADDLLRLFPDAEGGGFFFTGSDHEELLARTKDPYDGAIPSGNAVAARFLARLGELTLNATYADAARATVMAFGQEVAKMGFGYPAMMRAFDFVHGPAREIVIAGDPDAADTRALVAAVRKRFIPVAVIGLVGADGPSEEDAKAFVLLAGKKAIDGKAAAYVCESGVCHQPVTTVEELEKALDGT